MKTRLAPAFAMIAFAVLAGSSFGQVRPTTQTLLREAQAKAAKEGKVVFVHFTASWCGWCKKLEAFMEAKEVKPILAKAFVFVTLDVLESSDKKALETPGGLELLKSLKAEAEGIPFTVIYDATGKLLAQSKTDPNKPGTNIGYPAAASEIAHFLKMLEQAKKLTDADRAVIKNWLEANAPKG